MFFPHSHSPMATTVNSSMGTIPELFQISPFQFHQEGASSKEEVGVSPHFLVFASKVVGKVSSCDLLESKVP